MHGSCVLINRYYLFGVFQLKGQSNVHKTEVSNNDTKAMRRRFGWIIKVIVTEKHANTKFFMQDFRDPFLIYLEKEHARWPLRAQFEADL